MRLDPAHKPLPKLLPADITGKLVMMIREPHRRIASGYTDNLHDCRAMQKEFGVKEYQTSPHPNQPSCTNATEILRYAKCVEGCVLNMILGRYCSSGTKDRTKSDVDRAARIIENESGFVGLTDLWSTSVCVFAALFPPIIREKYDFNELFTNTNPSASPDCAKNVMEILRRYAYNDHYDHKMYTTARKRFESAQQRVVNTTTYVDCCDAAISNGRPPCEIIS